MPEHDGVRERGVLSKRDRAYIKGEKEPNSDTHERVIRNEIRHRIRNALLDFRLLLDVLPETDWENTFTPLDGQALVDTIGFLYVGSKHIDDLFFEEFADIVTAGIEQGATRTNEIANVDLTIATRTRDLDRLVEKAQTGATLTPSEWYVLSREAPDQLPDTSAFT